MGQMSFLGLTFFIELVRAVDEMTVSNVLPSHLNEKEREFVSRGESSSLDELIDSFSVIPPAVRSRLFKTPLLEQLIVNRIQRLVDDLTSQSHLSQILEFDCQNLLVEQILNYADLLGMAHSLEIRTPFLEPKLVDFCFSIPSAFKISGNCTKYLLKKVAERILPSELVYRPKEGFVEPNIFWLGARYEEWCPRCGA